MKLYMDQRWLSPYTYTVFCALREKEVSFEIEEVQFEKNRSITGDLAQKTFTDLIPALDDAGFVLSESLAILEYIEEKYSLPKHRSLFPSNIRARATARMALSWYRGGFTALRKERSTETVFYGDELRAKAPLSAEAQEEITDWKRFLTATLKPGAPFLFGEWSIADTETALMLHRLILNGDKVEKPLVDYARSIWERPSCAEFVKRARPEYRSYY